ncbi:MAG: hypothetical protein J7621_19430 [Niastella sp.]|nr:hypothetical protein [Niastella sp.]
MRNIKETYSCSIITNSYLEHSPYEKDGNATAYRIFQFLSDKDLGKGLRGFRFDIYIEPEINFGNHSDHIFAHTATLSAHIDYNAFVSADSNLRQKLLLNAVLVLCNFFVAKVPQPKDFDTAGLIQLYTAYLAAHDLLLTDEERQRFIIKPFETTSFKFVQSSTVEVNEKHILYDLIQIEDFLNNGLAGRRFGQSIREFQFGYEIYDFQGRMKPWAQNANLRRYSAKYKSLLIVKQFDYRQLKGKLLPEQLNILHSTIIEAIDDFDKLNKKPKDFNKEAFRSAVDNLLIAYAEKHCR